eukprot:5294729-Pleurochrysis_carterae.AAC.2
MSEGVSECKREGVSECKREGVRECKREGVRERKRAHMLNRREVASSPRCCRSRAPSDSSCGSACRSRPRCANHARLHVLSHDQLFEATRCSQKK